MSSATEIIDSLRRLSSDVAKLSVTLESLNPSLWEGWVLGIEDDIWKSAAESNIEPPPHSQAANIYSCLHHTHSGDGRDTWQMAGLLIVPPDVIELGQQVNASKERLEKTLFEYKFPGQKWEDRKKKADEKHPRKNVSIMQILHNASDSGRASESHMAREVLSRLGSSRLHLRHCTRKIRIMDEMPDSISLSWVKQRKSISKISISDCLDKLNELKSKDGKDPGIEAQIAIANRLTPEDENKLRLVQTVSTPSIKGKVYWPERDPTELGYLSMPALIKGDPANGKLPDFTRLSVKPPTTQRRRRKDSKLSADPLLSSIRVYLTS